MKKIYLMCIAYLVIIFGMTALFTSCLEPEVQETTETFYVDNFYTNSVTNTIVTNINMTTNIYYDQTNFSYTKSVLVTPPYNTNWSMSIGDYMLITDPDIDYTRSIQLFYWVNDMGWVLSSYGVMSNSLIIPNSQNRMSPSNIVVITWQR